MVSFDSPLLRVHSDQRLQVKWSSSTFSSPLCGKRGRQVCRANLTSYLPIQEWVSTSIPAYCLINSHVLSLDWLSAHFCKEWKLIFRTAIHSSPSLKSAEPTDSFLPVHLHFPPHWPSGREMTSCWICAVFSSVTSHVHSRSDWEDRHCTMQRLDYILFLAALIDRAADVHMEDHPRSLTGW